MRVRARHHEVRPPRSHTDGSNRRSEIQLRLIRSYESTVTRAYCWARFHILHQRFLDEIGQYLPHEGRCLDLGCGFGLFSLYYASILPRLHLHGIDKNARRIATARLSAARLGISNVTYSVENVVDSSSTLLGRDRAVSFVGTD